MNVQQTTFFANIATITKNLVHQATASCIKDRIPHIILGLSGGPDSVFLLYVLAHLQQQKLLTLTAAHLDHGWRESSAQDAAFCQQLCMQLNINYRQTHANDISLTKNYKGSQEALGRALRRTFFKQLATQLKADCITLAHHAQDQQETFFIRLLRGTTLDGLCSMKPIDDIFIRPLLMVNKADIITYLYTNNIPYCSDPSNLSDTFLRNRIRNHLIPAINRCDKRFSTTFQHSLDSLQKENDFLHHLAQTAYEDIFASARKNQSISNGIVGSKQTLERYHPAIQNRVIILWLIKEQTQCTLSSAFIQEIVRFLFNPRGGSHKISQHCSIHKKRDTFWIICTQN